MNALDIQLKSLIDCLSALKIDYVILGGLALSLYGEPRFTAGIDVNIMLDQEEIPKFLKNVKKYGFSPALANTGEVALECGVIPLNFRKGDTSGKFDLILAQNPLEYAAIQRGRMKNIGSLKANFVTPEDLVLHKITSSRPRDIEDLKGIILRQKGELDLRYIRHWLEKIDKVNKTRLYKLFKNLSKA